MEVASREQQAAPAQQVQQLSDAVTAAKEHAALLTASNASDKDALVAALSAAEAERKRLAQQLNSKELELNQLSEELHGVRAEMQRDRAASLQQHQAAAGKVAAAERQLADSNANVKDLQQQLQEALTAAQTNMTSTEQQVCMMHGSAWQRLCSTSGCCMLAASLYDYGRLSWHCAFMNLPVAQ